MTTDPIEIAIAFGHEVDARTNAAHQARAQDLADRTTRQLAELYDADLRTIDQRTFDMASRVPIPHPLRDVVYADGVYACGHEPKCWNKHTCIERFRHDAHGSNS